MPFSIEWESHLVHPDGRKRSRPPSSTIHGWLMKWRGTFSGNESVRSRGIREMKEAAAQREYYKQNPQRRPRAVSTGGLSFFRRSQPSHSSRRSNTVSKQHRAASHSNLRGASSSHRPTPPRRSNTAPARTPAHRSNTSHSRRSGHTSPKSGAATPRSGASARPKLQRGETSRRSTR